ncbi:MAG: plastocyanin/azurin family copper-binding protein [Byssovorax sp.]
MPCIDPTKDCPATGSECVKAICTEDETCGTENVAKDTPLAGQTTGDCKTAICDGSGGLGSKDDDNDIKDDSNPCTNDSCSMGSEVHAPSSAGTACTDATSANAKLCDGAGKCVECNPASAATDCASKVCQDNACVSAQCNDGVKNGNETDKDCGGPDCGGCADGKACTGSNDCTSAVCTGMVCQVPACDDNTMNGTETDKDCGGNTCAKCGPTLGCKMDSDCGGGSCNGTTCNPTCTDLVKNNGESDTDCGGANCQKCGDGKTCGGNADCMSLHCSGDPKVCQPPTCNDSIKNQGESDVDCGGPKCGPCATNKACGSNSDCVSAHCVTNLCAAPTCSDNIKNQGETDIDCGGMNCGACNTGKDCALNSDCTSLHCVGLVCAAPSCADGIKNQGETDIDCSGPCVAKCGPGKSCMANADCWGNVCGGGNTCTPNCSDLVKNNMETDVDCGGGTCGGCALGKACAMGSDCTSQICTTNVCSQINNCDPTTATNMTGMANVAINFANFSYAPPCIKVSAGTTVTFNGSFSTHPLRGGTVTGSGAGAVATPAASGPFVNVTSSGNSKPFVMSSQGTFPYYCTTHYPSGMMGTIFVVP